MLRHHCGRWLMRDDPEPPGGPFSTFKHTQQFGVHRPQHAHCSVPHLHLLHVHTATFASMTWKMYMRECGKQLSAKFKGPQRQGSNHSLMSCSIPGRCLILWPSGPSSKQLLACIGPWRRMVLSDPFAQRIGWEESENLDI